MQLLPPWLALGDDTRAKYSTEVSPNSLSVKGVDIWILMCPETFTYCSHYQTFILGCTFRQHTKSSHWLFLLLKCKTNAMC